MFFSKEDTTTLKMLGNIAITTNIQGNRKEYNISHQALEDFLLKLRSKYPNKFREIENV